MVPILFKDLINVIKNTTDSRVQREKIEEVFVAVLNADLSLGEHEELILKGIEELSAVSLQNIECLGLSA